MPTNLGEPFSPLWRGRYPHMLEEDWPVWDQFLNQNLDLFERVYYDVWVGGIYPGPEISDEKYRKVYWQNTAKRIDVLGELKNEIWIIEVASNPGLRAVGQLMTYWALWWDDPKSTKPVKGVLVCRGIDQDLERALEIYGMLVRYAV